MWVVCTSDHYTMVDGYKLNKHVYTVHVLWNTAAVFLVVTTRSYERKRHLLVGTCIVHIWTYTPV